MILWNRSNSAVGRLHDCNRRSQHSQECKDPHCTTAIEEASTHKSAKTHAGSFFATHDLNFWPFDPKNKWVSTTSILEHLCVKFGDRSCIGFWDIVQENRHTDKQWRKPYPRRTATAHGECSESSECSCRFIYGLRNWTDFLLVISVVIVHYSLHRHNLKPGPQ